MSRTMVKALHNNFKNTFGLIRDTISNFDEESWRKEYTWFLVPARVAYHNIECVDFYYRDLSTPFTWGYRFGKNLWDTPIDEQPTQPELLTYLGELEARVAARFDAMEDEDLEEIYDTTADAPMTKAAHYTYALRHTVHHQGSLAALGDILGAPSADWDKYADYD